MSIWVGIVGLGFFTNLSILSTLLTNKYLATELPAWYLFVYQILMEQGSQVYAKLTTKFQRFLATLTIVWILMGVVLSNAYRGENISKLAKAIEYRGPKTFQDLVEKNIRVISKLTPL